MGFKGIVELDDFALKAAVDLAARQPRCDQTTNQLPVLTVPSLSDTVPIWHGATGETEQVSLQTLGQLIGGGGGGTSFISQQTNFTNFAANYGYFVQQAGGPTTGANTTAMTTMLAAMGASTPSGGIAYIPQASYSINFSGGGFTVPQGAVLYALGEGGSGISNVPDIFHFTAAGDGTLFNSSGPHGYAGAWYYNLSLLASSPTQQSTCAINGAVLNVSVQNCFFQNWPIAFYCSSTGGRFIGCGIQLTNNGLNGPTPTVTNGCTIPNLSALPGVGPGFQVIVQANQTLIMGPGEWDDNSQGTKNVGAIALGGVNSSGPTEHCTIRDYHLSDWTWGISYNHSLASASPVKATHVSSIHAQSYASCVLMMVGHANSSIYGEKYIGCNFQKSHASTDSSPLIYVDATTNTSSANNIDDIEFTNCTVFGDANSPQANQYGYNLFSCSDFRINGGCVSNMGSTGGACANVAITGPVATVTLTGVNLKSNYPNANNHTNYSNYGLLVFGASLASNSNIQLESCIFDANYVTAPVHVTGTVTSGAVIQITDCAGYNDQNTAILANASAAPITGSSAQSASTAGSLSGGVNYYGPSVIMFTAGSSGVTFTINGLAQTIPANQAYIAYIPNSFDKISFSSAASTAIATGTLLWVGK